MLKPFKDQAGNVRFTIVEAPEFVLVVPRYIYEEFIRGVFAGEYDYSTLERYIEDVPGI